MVAATGDTSLTAWGRTTSVLKQGSSQYRGESAYRNNIAAARLVAEIVKSSLGPRSMDKLIIPEVGEFTITNDGFTMLSEMKAEHPAARLLVETARVMHFGVGDGTKSVVIFAGALLEKAEALLDRGVHPIVIIDGFAEAADKALEILYRGGERIDPHDDAMLANLVRVSMQSRFIRDSADRLTELVLRAARTVAEKDARGRYVLELDRVKILKKPSGSLSQTTMVSGIVLDRTIESSSMPRRVENARIALIDKPLLIIKPKIEAKLEIDSPRMLRRFIEKEIHMLKESAEKIIASGANVVVNFDGFDDVALDRLARAGVMAFRVIQKNDLDLLEKVTGGETVADLDELDESKIGSATVVEERRLGLHDWMFVEGGVSAPKAVSLLVLGTELRVVFEAERCLQDGLRIVRDVLDSPRVVVGGGATEAELAYRISKWARRKVKGRKQVVAESYAEALECIPVALAENAGMNTLEVRAELRGMHARGYRWFGVDPVRGKVCDVRSENVFEPLAVKEQIIISATEIVNLILRVDNLIILKREPPAPRLTNRAEDPALFGLDLLKKEGRERVERRIRDSEWPNKPK